MAAKYKIIVDAIDKDQWRNFACSFGDYSIYQSWGYQQVRSESVRVEAGPGIIIQVGPIDLRTALHVGLTREAPDLIGSFWLSWKWPIW